MLATTAVVAFLNKPLPVSYTHLDVYKRQDLIALLSKLTNALGTAKLKHKVSSKLVCECCSCVCNIGNCFKLVVKPDKSRGRAVFKAMRAVMRSISPIDLRVWLNIKISFLMSSAIASCRFNTKSVSYTHLDVYKRQTLNRVYLAISIAFYKDSDKLSIVPNCD